MGWKIEYLTILVPCYVITLLYNIDSIQFKLKYFIDIGINADTIGISISESAFMESLLASWKSNDV